MNCPKYRSVKAVKNGTMRGKQRYKCKDCGCNYTQSESRKIPLSIKIEALKLYLEGVGFRAIERLTGVCHTTVMRWVKRLADEIETMRPEVSEQVMTVELDEMWHFMQKKAKKCWVWLAWDREGKRCLGVQLGRRNKSTGLKLWKQLQLFDIGQVCSDYFPVYPQIVQHPNHLITKAETWGVESLNSRIRHYLARFRRKTFCYSKALHMVKATLTLYFTPNWKTYLC